MYARYIMVKDHVSYVLMSSTGKEKMVRENILPKIKITWSCLAYETGRNVFTLLDAVSLLNISGYFGISLPITTWTYKPIYMFQGFLQLHLDIMVEFCMPV